ncbi:MAG: outer membrane protein transport protein [Holophagales bacterium]|nr:outer membrane protein transport protein [Holophagales bacterium]
MLSIANAGAAAAQDPDPPTPPPVQRDLPALSSFSVVPFDFGPPGARSLGMGGTFVALADDATAAEANPAGLTQLSRPEVSIHGRHAETEIETVDLNAVTSLDQLNRNRTFPTRLVPGTTLANAFATGTRVRFDPEVDDATFASYVHPSDTYTFSVFYQRSTNFSGADGFRAFDDSVMDLYITRQQLDLRVDNVGVSAAFEAGEALSVGFSVRYSMLDARAFQDIRIDYGADLELAMLPAGSSLEQVEALGILDQRIQSQEFDDSDSDITFNVGLLWKPHRRISFGLVYKSGGSFVIGGTNFDFGCLDPSPPPGTRGCEPREQNRVEQRFQVPDFLGLGLAWRVTDRLKLALDLSAIEYSVLDVSPAPNPDLSPEVLRDFEAIDDEVEVHLGIEQIFLVGRRQVPFMVRAGVYTDPDHDGIVNIDSEETVYTFGLGTVIGESFQIDLAGRTGERSEAGILSMVYRF